MRATIILIMACMALLGMSPLLWAADGGEKGDSFLESLKEVPVTIHCRDADVNLLLRGIARQAGVNIMCPRTLKAR